MVKIIEGQKTVPMIAHCIMLITMSIVIYIMCFWAFAKAMMLNYNIYYFENIS